jgi:hypothetical protein
MPDGMSEIEVDLIRETRMFMREKILGWGDQPSREMAEKLCARLSLMIGETYQFDTGVAMPISSEE